METPKQPPKPAHLLDDLESIRALLDQPGSNEPPLLTDPLEADGIPLLSDIIEPALSAPLQPAPEPPLLQPLVDTVRNRLEPDASAEPADLDAELRATAQAILQDVIDDFVPQIEAELKRRLEAHMAHLLAPPKR
ncbi:DNA polymerase III subunit chi [Pseudomonas boanensis]|uniref:DNA polymerase III subunit chi n=1 Tax=Metapseudomonas boanensis TaxID=2822138 RepID=UPI0035D4DE8B